MDICSQHHWDTYLLQHLVINVLHINLQLIVQVFLLKLQQKDLHNQLRIYIRVVINYGQR